MNSQVVYNRITTWIKEKIELAGVGGAVIGISGGIDSAVVTVLTRAAVGTGKIHGLVMPYYHDNNFSDAISVVNTIRIQYSTIWICDIYEAYYRTGLLWNNKTKENTMSRIRTDLLRAYANEHNLLVVGTSNADEYFVGYCTKGGDLDTDISPIIPLTKGQVYEMAKYINEAEIAVIPDKIISKKPTAGLSPNQTDEDDLGLTYDELDKLVIERKYGIPAQISNEKRDLFNKLFELSSHKRASIQYPEIPITFLMPDYFH